MKIAIYSRVSTLKQDTETGGRGSVSDSAFASPEASIEAVSATVEASDSA